MNKLTEQDKPGKYVYCTKCTFKSYEPEHFNVNKCPNCKCKWN